MIKKYFWLLAVSLLLTLPKPVNASSSVEATVSLVPTLTQATIGAESQVLFSFTVTNNKPQPVDIRSITFKNTGDLALEQVLDDIEFIPSQGGNIVTRQAIRDRWDTVRKELVDSEVQIWVENTVLDPKETRSFTFRSTLKGGVADKTLQFKTGAVSVLVPDTNFVRDLLLDTSDVEQGLILVGEGDYSPVIKDWEESALLPDLIVEGIYFTEEYGHQKDMIIVPICNKGNGSTKDGSRIEGTVFAPNNYLRDFIIRKTLAPGKCFEQAFSAKRDLRINAAKNHQIRVEVDLQNAIEEERENNNARLDTIEIKDESVNTNSVNLSQQPLSLRQRLLERLGLKRTRPNVLQRTAVHEQTKTRPYSSRTTYRPWEKEEEKEDYTIHPNYGDTAKYLGAKDNLKIFTRGSENDIIREELPETAEDVWRKTSWERVSAQRRIRLNRSVENVAAPASDPENDRRPTFRNPTAIHKYRTSYRGLRSGVRPDTQYRGQRTNNQPEFSTQDDFNVFCRDSDGLDVFEKGTVTYKSRRMPKQRQQTDETRGDYVLEYYCEGDYMRRKLFTCDEKTGNGICEEE